MQWRKLFDLDPVYSVFSDKTTAREFVRSQLGDTYLPPLLWAGSDPEHIPFDDLAIPYFLKGTHGSGQAIYVGKECDIDRKLRIIDEVREWLRQNHGSNTLEPGYVDIRPGIVIERDLSYPDNSILEIKAYVFKGVVQCFIVVRVVEESRKRIAAHVTREWQLIPRRLVCDEKMTSLPPRPIRLDEAISVAEKLATGLDHLRVDMYETEDHLYIGELTVYSHSGLAVFEPDHEDYVLGSYWNADFSVARALRAVFGGPPLHCRV